MAPDLPQVCLGLHMSPWPVSLQETSGGSVARPNVSVSGLESIVRSAKKKNSKSWYVQESKYKQLWLSPIM